MKIKRRSGVVQPWSRQRPQCESQ